METIGQQYHKELYSIHEGILHLNQSKLNNLKLDLQMESAAFAHHVHNFNKTNPNGPSRFRFSEKMWPDDQKNFNFVAVAGDLVEMLTTCTPLDCKQI